MCRGLAGRPKLPGTKHCFMLWVRSPAAQLPATGKPAVSLLQELGFEVIELNAGSDRTGARLVADLSEALQSDTMARKKVQRIFCWDAVAAWRMLPAQDVRLISVMLHLRSSWVLLLARQFARLCCAVQPGRTRCAPGRTRCQQHPQAFLVGIVPASSKL